MDDRYGSKTLANVDRDIFEAMHKIIKKEIIISDLEQKNFTLRNKIEDFKKNKTFFFDFVNEMKEKENISNIVKEKQKLMMEKLNSRTNYLTVKYYHLQHNIISENREKYEDKINEQHGENFKFYKNIGIVKEYFNSKEKREEQLENIIKKNKNISILSAKKQELQNEIKAKHTELMLKQQRLEDLKAKKKNCIQEKEDKLQKTKIKLEQLKMELLEKKKIISMKNSKNIPQSTNELNTNNSISGDLTDHSANEIPPKIKTFEIIHNLMKPDNYPFKIPSNPKSAKKKPTSKRKRLLETVDNELNFDNELFDSKHKKNEPKLYNTFSDKNNDLTKEQIVIQLDRPLQIGSPRTPVKGKKKKKTEHFDENIIEENGKNNENTLQSNTALHKKSSEKHKIKHDEKVINKNKMMIPNIEKKISKIRTADMSTGSLETNEFISEKNTAKLNLSPIFSNTITVQSAPTQMKNISNYEITDENPKKKQKILQKSHLHPSETKEQQSQLVKKSNVDIEENSQFLLNENEDFITEIFNSKINLEQDFSNKKTEKNNINIEENYQLSAVKEKCSSEKNSVATTKLNQNKNQEISKRFEKDSELASVPINVNDLNVSTLSAESVPSFLNDLTLNDHDKHENAEENLNLTFDEKFDENEVSDVLNMSTNSFLNSNFEVNFEKDMDNVGGFDMKFDESTSGAESNLDGGSESNQPFNFF